MSGNKGAGNGNASDPPGRQGGPFNRRGLHGIVAHHLGVRIVSGEYGANSILPPEAEFSEQLNVSRTSFREAVKVLAAKGFLESRPKIGTRVLPRAQWNLMDPDVLAWHFEAEPYPEFARELFELRQILEPPASEMAASRRTDDDIAAIGAAFRDMEGASPGTDDAISADLRFHKAIITAAHNSLLGSLGDLIETALLGSFRLSKQSRPSAHSDSLPGHKAILDAISAGDAAAARLATEVLLETSQDDLLNAIND